MLFGIGESPTGGMIVYAPIDIGIRPCGVKVHWWLFVLILIFFTFNLVECVAQICHWVT